MKIPTTREILMEFVKRTCPSQQEIEFVDYCEQLFDLNRAQYEALFSEVDTKQDEALKTVAKGFMFLAAAYKSRMEQEQIKASIRLSSPALVKGKDAIH